VRHLFASQVEVLRLGGTMVDGTPQLSWAKVADVIDVLLGVPGELMCRLDLNFLRLGKDQPMAVVAGRAPDRVGVLFCDPTDGLRGGDRVRAVAGPVAGTFELRAIPDIAVGFAAGHHLEVQVVEVTQNLTSYPSGIPSPVVTP